ncbi:MAG TPA: ABC transporter substrate-binding protein [Chthoniobacterales bacterium]
MFRIAAVFAALAIVVGIPFALKPKQNLLAAADDTLVIISPHNGAIRYEFTRAFAEFYQKQTGRTVRIDWRLVGGTSEIAKYLKSEYYAAFQRAWVAEGRAWNAEVEAAFDNPQVKPSESSGAGTPAQAARRAFLKSDAGIGIDLFFGGGSYDFIQQANAGRLVDSGLLRAKPEWFTDAAIPPSVSGETYYDRAGRWIGACISSFGICYNTDSLRRLGFTSIPAAWSDLADPRFVQQVALADPTKSGSAAKAYEMIIQQQMQERVAKLGETPEALAAGWAAGLRIIQRVSANARYFTDAASKVPLDVSAGDAAIGMCIDFYGRFQSEAVKLADGSSRLQYFTPAGGSSPSVDPIGQLRGAPNAKIARFFMEYALSLEGQKLWNFRVGAPGGPVRYALRRLPVLKELYAPQYAEYRSDPEVNPYREAGTFYYHSEWTGHLLRVLSFIIRNLSLDSHDELTAAWQALIAADFPPEATAKFSDLSAVDYALAQGRLRDVTRSADRIQEVQLAQELGDHFRNQYREAARLAKEGR